MAEKKDQENSNRDQEALAEAERRIEEARRRNATQLDLRRLSLAAVPENLGQLRFLKELDLSSNKLASLPESLGQLYSLQVLNLGHNHLASLPESLGQLGALQGLYLPDNHLASLPGCLQQLGSLQSLDLSGNQLGCLPAFLGRIHSLKGLFVHENPVLQIPLEVLGPTREEIERLHSKPVNPRDILTYYFAVMDGARPLNEAKLLLVGRGGAGKSSIRDAMVGREFDPRRVETPGIDIEVAQSLIEAGDMDGVTFHIWDFAGQTITHSTHQFFLTERSLYVVVIEGRMDTQNSDAEYWLKLVSSFGKNSPVIVCLNKFEEAPFAVNEVALRSKYTTIRAILKTDCKTRLGIADLVREIWHAVNATPEVRQKFPKAWWDAKERFSKMPEDYLSLEDFRKECANHGEADPGRQESLARILHQLGILLHFGDDELKDITVLNPHWVTKNIYTLLRLKQGSGTDGTLTREEAAAALPTANARELDYLLGLMRKFELCFPVTSKPGVLLVPDLLPENPANPLGDWREGQPGLLRLRYEYSVLPEGLIPRLITRTYPMSLDQVRWRYGVILEADGARSLVVADSAEQRIDVAIAGDTLAQERLAKVVRHHFAHLNQDFGGLNPQELIEVRDHPGIFQRVDVLLKDEERGNPSMMVSDEGTEVIDQKAELDRISSEASRKERGPRLRIFVCYSHADSDMFDLFRSRNLAAMEMDGLISTWTDRQIPLGAQWNGTIKKELEEADMVLCLVSTPFFASDYIQGVEMVRALKLAEEGKLKVIPILLEYSPAWERSVLHTLQAIVPDGKPVRVNRRPPDALNVVERELGESIRKLANSGERQHGENPKRFALLAKDEAAPLATLPPLDENAGKCCIAARITRKRFAMEVEVEAGIELLELVDSLEMELRLASQDDSLTVFGFRGGSILVMLEGNETGIQHLMMQYKQGRLTHLRGRRIVYMRALGDGNCQYEVFISYKRVDTKAYSRLVVQRLADVVPRKWIFIDESKIEIGASISEEIEAALITCKVFVALIGNQWLPISKWVQKEILLALAHDLDIIPLLCGEGVGPLRPSDLPTDIERFGTLKAATLDSGAEFDSEIEKLVNRVAEGIARF